MFGLMTPRHTCGGSSQQKNAYRQHYCGVCKSIGKDYSVKGRAFLNFDTVFLSELLGQLSHDKQQSAFPKDFSTGNCFSLPSSAESMPKGTRYAAAVNVLLTQLKVQDNLWDSGAVKWKVLRSFLNTDATKAAAYLQQYGVDTNELYALAARQLALEQKTTSDTSIEAFAEATSQMTAIVFSGAAQAIDSPFIASELEQLGSSFGSLVYWLDAYEDMESDQKNGTFNPANQLNQDAAVARQTLRKLLDASETQVHASIAALPLDASWIEQFQARLSANLARRYYKVEYPAPSMLSPQTWKNALRQRVEKAQAFAAEAVLGGNRGVLAVRYYSFLIAAMAIPQVQDGITPGTDTKQKMTYLGLLTAMLAAIGIGKKAQKKCCGNQNGGIKKLNDPCCCSGDDAGECCGACCSVCATGACSGCCDTCTSDACEWCCDFQDDDPSAKAARTTLWIIFGILMIGLIVYVAIYVR